MEVNNSRWDQCFHVVVNKNVVVFYFNLSLTEIIFFKVMILSAFHQTGDNTEISTSTK